MIWWLERPAVTVNMAPRYWSSLLGCVSCSIPISLKTTNFNSSNCNGDKNSFSVSVITRIRSVPITNQSPQSFVRPSLVLYMVINVWDRLSLVGRFMRRSTRQDFLRATRLLQRLITLIKRQHTQLVTKWTYSISRLQTV